jgi:hypothetical protein
MKDTIELGKGTHLRASACAKAFPAALAFSLALLNS